MTEKLLAYIDREEHKHLFLLIAVLSVGFVSVIGFGIAKFVSAAGGNTYYVSPTGSGSACTQVAPCGSFNTAYQMASSDDTVIVEAGTYASQTIAYDGTKTTPVIFQAERDGSGNAANITTDISVNGASHIVFDGRDADGIYRDHWKMIGFATKASSGHNPTDVTVYGMHYSQMNGNATVYIEGPSNHISVIGGELGPNIGDGIQIWTRASDNAGTSDILVQGLYCHDNDALAPGAQPNCIQVHSASWHGNNKTYIIGNYFKHNDDSNLQCDGTSDNVIVANNIFEDTYSGTSGGSGSLAVRCNTSSTQYLYNTFVGSQQIQEPPQNVGGSPRLYTLIGNLGNGGDQGCMVESTYSHNVWSANGAGQTCGTGDLANQNLKINADGSLQAGSPAIGAGDTAIFPLTDYTGLTRATPPDAGALSFGSSFTTAPNNYTIQSITTPDNTVRPTLGGTTTVGQQLTATNGTWTNSPTNYRYQWQRCANDYSKCFNITGANSQNYTLTNNEANTHVSVVVQAINAAGSMTSWSDYTAAVASVTSPPSNTAVPTISGTAIEANQLSTTNGTWTNSPTSYTYKWQRCDTSGNNCADISGATASTYTLATADVTHTVRSVVTAVNAGGQASANSAVSAVVAADATPPSNTVLPTISGTAAVGGTLTASPGSWTGSPSFTYQWKRCDAAGANCTSISGANNQNYTPVQADADVKLKVTVTGTNGAGSDTATSSASNTIQAVLGDFNSDGHVNIFDLGIFLSHFLSGSSPAQDLNSDGIVNLFDLGIFLNHYNT
jgi:hypothetical protein